MKTRRNLALGIASLFAAGLVILPSHLVAAENKSKEEGDQYMKRLIEMKSVTVNIFRSDYRAGKLEIAINLDVPNAELFERAELSQPRLRAAYIQALTALVYDLPQRQPPDLKQMVFELQKVTDKVLGRPGARVLLSAVIIN
jgi:hypothetical protein